MGTADVVLAAILSAIVSGLIVGALARFALPGSDDMPIWKTILLGVLGSLVGGFVAGLLGLVDDDGTLAGGEIVTLFLCSLAGAVLLLILYRKFAQGRSITGPDAQP